MSSVSSDSSRQLFQRYLDRTESTGFKTSGKRYQVNRILHPQDATSTGRFVDSFLESDIIRIVGPMLKAIEENRNVPVVNEAKDLAINIIELMVDLQKTNVEIGNIPALHATNLDDGSLLVEWLFVNYRIGFSIGLRAEDSTWYLIATGSSLDSGQFGILSSKEKKALLARLVSVVVSNS